jgi:hypothetical protein
MHAEALNVGGGIQCTAEKVDCVLRLVWNNCATALASRELRRSRICALTSVSLRRSVKRDATAMARPARMAQAPKRFQNERDFMAQTAWSHADSQNLNRNSTQALLGAPGEKKVALCNGKSPSALAGKGRARNVPCAVSPVFASCAAV